MKHGLAQAMHRGAAGVHSVTPLIPESVLLSLIREELTFGIKICRKKWKKRQFVQINLADTRIE